MEMRKTAEEMDKCRSHPKRVGWSIFSWKFDSTDTALFFGITALAVGCILSNVGNSLYYNWKYSFCAKGEKAHHNKAVANR